ncbi:hypothetical protein F4860DRAFT_525836 [Xylaria cubensis]|nr:hypothetical protein F4860DRAFT_525836 [Xylaria cubensis]
MATIMPRGYLSATEYSFREEQADAIVRRAAYHRKDFPLSSIATSFPRTSHTGLGCLDRLPLELLHDVSRNIVDSVWHYRIVVSHGLKLACSFCGKFGAFISLLTWSRCCFKCLQEDPETQVQFLAVVRKHFHLTKAESNQLRSFKTLPGIYVMIESRYKLHIKVVSIHQAMLITGRRLPVNSGRNLKYNFMGSCALPYYDRRTGKARDKVYAQDGFLEHFRRCKQGQFLWRSSDEGNHRPTSFQWVLGEEAIFA